MTKTEIKMNLLREFGGACEKKSIDFCREAYKFLTEGETEDTMAVTTSCSPSEVTAVDLGLPSGRLWADRNVGAKSPEDYGAFFSWGNVEPHFPNKGNMDWGDNEGAFDYEFNDENYERTPGYSLSGDIGDANDAATVNLGEPWCMPAEDDFKELFDYCDWTRKTVNGVNGYLVTSRINGNALFFPCSGTGYGSSWNNRGSYGNYWSRSLGSSAFGRVLYFGSGGVNPQDYYNRFLGFAVRPVQNTSTR